jgi:bifunctional DNA-binding transcriptional regulator/antitoxin component of YhaV-PrlF toxin-antitoxin module
MASIKLTSKRQATFPVEVCRQLGVCPGDSLELAAICHDSETVWILKPAKQRCPSWLGRLRKYVQPAREPWSREHHGAAAARAMAAESGK